MTVDQLLFALTLCAALGCGLIAGIYFAFSAFLMKALSRLPAREGMAAMQSINVVILRSWFMVVFFGTAIACVVALICSLLRWHEPRAVYLFLGSVLYLVGSLLITIVFNVPRNEVLASVTSDSPDGPRTWTNYVVSWTTWNHVRTVASLAAAASFSLAIAH